MACLLLSAHALAVPKGQELSEKGDEFAVGGPALCREELGLHFADAGRWGVELAYDGVHFTENGSRSFASGLKKALIPIIYV